MKNLIVFLLLYSTLFAQNRGNITFNDIQFQYEHDEQRNCYTYIDTTYEQWCNKEFERECIFTIILSSIDAEVYISPIFVHQSNNLFQIDKITMKIDDEKFVFEHGIDYKYKQRYGGFKPMSIMVFNVNDNTYKMLQKFRDASVIRYELRGGSRIIKDKMPMETIRHLRKSLKFIYGFNYIKLKQI